MNTFKLALASLFMTGTLFISGCGGGPSMGSVSDADFVYHGHNFGENRNADYKHGVKDGCTTSDGNYKKNHTLYKNDLSYHDGWEHGRLHCTGAK